MESQKVIKSYEALSMNAGDGEYSYFQNSTIQRRATDILNNIIKDAILENLQLETLFQHSNNVFRIADLGCSVGPNTFYNVESILEAVTRKFQSQGCDLDSLEFQVFFNDHAGNDFNTLFWSLPENKKYYAAAVPGSFQGRLFPKSSIHIFYSSYALHWLSMVPKDIVDKNSPAYNKGRIYLTDAAKEVAEAYSAQFARDMESFLNSRALELVHGGIITLIIPAVPPNSKNDVEAGVKIMEDVLLEMTNKGIISDEFVDSFNMPFYIPALEEVKELIEQNGNFRIEKSESLVRLVTDVQKRDVHVTCMHVRAGWEGLFKEHFGEEVVDDIFMQYEKKLAESSLITDPTYKMLGELFVIKRIFV